MKNDIATYSRRLLCKFFKEAKCEREFAVLEAQIIFRQD